MIINDWVEIEWKPDLVLALLQKLNLSVAEINEQGSTDDIQYQVILDACVIPKNTSREFILWAKQRIIKEKQFYDGMRSIYKINPKHGKAKILFQLFNYSNDIRVMIYGGFNSDSGHKIIRETYQAIRQQELMVKLTGINELYD